MTAQPTRTPDLALELAGWAAIVAPVIGLMLKLASPGWLVVAMIWTFPVWIIGWVLVVLAASRGMIRARGSLRAPAVARRRAIVWAWLASVGVLVVGFTMVDGGDTSESVGSTLTRMLGWTGGDGGPTDVSMTIALIAAVPWVLGSAALVVEWLVSISRRKPEAARVAPPVVG